MKNIMLIVILWFSIDSYCQEIPLPQRCFPLNGTNTEDIMSGQEADVHATVHALTDRFGINGKAISFDREGGYFYFPVIATDEKEYGELTLTYWMYAGKDSIAQAFWAKDNEDNLLLGMRKKGRRAVLNIYHKDRHQNVLPDQQWMWEDSSFGEGEGWYFVAIAYSENGTHFYMATPAGKMTECYSAFTPDWNLVSSICIGTMDGIPAAGMDDFKVYDTALSKDQIAMLYQSESQLGMGEETLVNVATNLSLDSSAWYFHCVGLHEYVLQKKSDMSFLNADAGYALSMVADVDSEQQKWTLNLVEDISKGTVFTIANVATGLNLDNVMEEVIQQVADNSDSQKWYMGQWERSGLLKSKIENIDVAPLKEEIYYDKDAGVVRIHILFPESENVKIKLFNSQGALINELYMTSVQDLDKNISLKVNGIYLVLVESTDYRINKKLFVNY